MVQFSIAYVALGCAVLLLLAGIFAARQHSVRMLSDTQRAVVLGGIAGMVVFFVVLGFWVL